VVQQVIREEFRDHTVISIAHRLDTIVDFDRVVVLEKGCLVEEGNPRELLRVSSSRFKALWDASRRHEGTGKEQV
jgi:ATP-binding cassette, subfamily C (CFTR/MRP), member 1